jgi:hypothetical protein
VVAEIPITHPRRPRSTAETAAIHSDIARALGKATPREISEGLGRA